MITARGKSDTMDSEIFRVTKNKLGESSLSGLTLENRDYVIRFFYSGNYRKDMDACSLNPYAIIMSCSIKTRRTLPLNYYMGKFSIKNVMPQFIDTDDYLKALEKAVSAMERLKGVHAYYFPLKQKEDKP